MEVKTINADIAIIGAGVVGCAVARELSLAYPDKDIIVLEKLEAAGLETSSRNSGVLHSGIHQNPNFLKSKLAEEGNKLAVEYVKEKGLDIIDSGMLIAVTLSEVATGLYKEFSILWNLLRNAKNQGIKVKFLTPFGTKKLAPGIKAFLGIFMPEARVIDPVQFTNSLKADAEENGVRFYFNSETQNIRKQRSEYHIFTPPPFGETKKEAGFTPDYIIKTGAVVNAAGLYADNVAAMAGFEGYKIYPWRGEYYEVVGEKKDMVNLLVYPAVPNDSPSKGIHFGPRVDGRLFIGPNARPVEHRDDYKNDKTPVEVFAKHARKYFPQLKKEDLRWAYSGIRPKTTLGAEESDFIINMDSKEPAFINLIGIESPGLTASMAIGKYVRNLLNK